MRGIRISRAARKEIDIVVVAARYEKDGKVELVQAYRRNGLIWHDIQLLDRATLIRYLKQGLRLVAGKPKDIEADFEVTAPIHHDPENDILAGDDTSAKDDLQVPLF